MSTELKHSETTGTTHYFTIHQQRHKTWKTKGRERERSKFHLPPSHTHSPKKKPTIRESNLFEVHCDFGLYKRKQVKKKRNVEFIKK